MHRPAATTARILTIAAVLLASLGAGFATADEPAVAPADVYLGATQSSWLSSYGADGRDVTVAVIDTGAADVPALDGVVIHQQNISSAPDEGDQFGHGTFVIGLVNAAAPGAKIVSIKLSDANGAVDVTQVLAALQWVIANKERFSIDVVNLSFGNDSKQSAYSSPLNFAVQRVWDNGIVVVASAGNLGDQPGTVTKPADDPLIISVGATDTAGTASIDDDSIPAFGSRGPTQDGLAKPDLVAPGTRVVSLRAPGSTADVHNPQARVGEHGFRGSGTSFSAPIVSGIVAQMLSIDPTLTPDQVKHGLLTSARQVSGDPTAAGAGTVRALAAVYAAREGRANRNVQRSHGRGSLHLARGSAIVEVETTVELPGGVTTDVDVPVIGDATAVTTDDEQTVADLSIAEVVDETLDSFDKTEFLDESNWDASHWGASHWGASHWGASHWGASHWGASHWGASQWWASHWG